MISSEIGQYLSLVFSFFLVFAMTATCSFKGFKTQLKNRRGIITGLILQFILMPFYGYVAVKTFGRLEEPVIGLTLLVVTSSPGGSFSNLFCNVFNAELGLSVAMTTFSSIIGTCMLPVNLLLYSFAAFGVGSSILQSLQWSGIFMSLGVILFGVLCGTASSIRFSSRRFRSVVNKMGTLSGLSLIILSFVTSSQQEDAQVWNRPWSFYPTVALPVILGVVTSTMIVMALGFNGPERMSVTIECTMQNVGIGLSVAMGAFDSQELRGLALGVPLFFGTVQMITIVFYCLSAWKIGWSKAPKDETICVILGASYEIGQDADVPQNQGALVDVEAGVRANREDGPHLNEQIQGTKSSESSTSVETSDTENSKKSPNLKARIDSFESTTKTTTNK